MKKFKSYLFITAIIVFLFLSIIVVYNNNERINEYELQFKAPFIELNSKTIYDSKN